MVGFASASATTRLAASTRAGALVREAVPGLGQLVPCAPVSASITFSDSAMIKHPMGMKTQPTRKKVRMTTLGVRIGRHALSVCCLKGLLSGGGMGPAAAAARSAGLLQRV